MKNVLISHTKESWDNLLVVSKFRKFDKSRTVRVLLAEEAARILKKDFPAVSTEIKTNCGCCGKEYIITQENVGNSGLCEKCCKDI